MIVGRERQRVNLKEQYKICEISISSKTAFQSCFYQHRSADLLVGCSLFFLEELRDNVNSYADTDSGVGNIK